MKLHNLINEKCCIFFNDFNDKKNILEFFLKHLYEHSSLQDEDISFPNILQELLNREDEQTTALGRGFAFPHARLKGIKGIYTLIAVNKNGIDFDSLDKKKTHFFITTLVPHNNPGILIKIRAALINFLKQENIQKTIFNADKASIILDLLAESNINLNREILAKDIMKAYDGIIDPEMTLQQAAAKFHKHHCDTLPIISNENKFLGVLSCHDLFAFKLPNFFNSLHSISFIKQMNPLEKYFQSDTNTTIKELDIKKNNFIIDHEATLMEIIFEFTVKNKEILYIIKNNTLLGIIDRNSIIDKVLLLNAE